MLKVGFRTLKTSFYIFFGRFRVRPFLGPVHSLTAKPRKPWVSEILSPALPFPQFEPFLNLPQSYSSQSFTLLSSREEGCKRANLIKFFLEVFPSFSCPKAQSPHPNIQDWLLPKKRNKAGRAEEQKVHENIY